MIFDTHAHYDDHAFDGDREAVLASLSSFGVGKVIDVGSTVRSLDEVRRIADTHDNVYGAVGLHPDDVGPHSRAALNAGGPQMSSPEGESSGGVLGEASSEKGISDRMQEPAWTYSSACGLTKNVKNKIRNMLYEDPKLVAVGEIGLDYHWDVEPHDVQIRCFKEQIEIALELKRPIIVHSRSAAADTMAVIEEMYGPGKKGHKEYGKWIPGTPPGPGASVERKGIIHAYAYSLEQAKIYTEMGFCLGIGGVLTFGNSRKLKKVVQNIPLEYLVLETDCPYLAPEPHRGERNFSGYLPYVVSAIAELKGITPEEVERVTWDNAMRLFGLA